MANLLVKFNGLSKSTSKLHAAVPSSGPSNQVFRAVDNQEPITYISVVFLTPFLKSTIFMCFDAQIIISSVDFYMTLFPPFCIS